MPLARREFVGALERTIGYLGLRVCGLADLHRSFGGGQSRWHNSAEAAIFLDPDEPAATEENCETKPPAPHHCWACASDGLGRY